MIEYQCDHPQCIITLFGYKIKCGLCMGVWCETHNNDTNHECFSIKQGDTEAYRAVRKKAEDRRILALLNKLRQHQESIHNEIRHLRPSHQFILDLPEDFDTVKQSKWYAGFNVHFLITFDDGIKWLLRVRQNDGREIPSDMAHPSIISEATTLNVLRDHGLPVPRAWISNFIINTKASKVYPLDYFFYEFMEGTPQPLAINTFFYGPFSLNDTQMEQLVENFAKSQVLLSNIRLPYKKIGCIFPSSSEKDGTEVGPIISQGGFMKPNPPHFFGPFDTLREMYIARIDCALEYILIDALGGEPQIDDCLWHLEMRELVSASMVLGEKPDQLYIKHVDARGDHMLVDGGGKMVSIIDWEWALVTTKADAFSQALFSETKEYVFKGDNTLTPLEMMIIDYHEKHGRSDLAECIRGGRLYARLEYIGRYDKARVKSGYRDVFRGDIPEGFRPPAADGDWRVYMMKRYREHEGLRKFMEKFGWTLERAEREAEEWHTRQA